MAMNRVFLLIACFFISLATQAAEPQGNGQTVTLSSNLAAEVVSVKVREGAQVKRGAVLLQLEAVVAQARLKRAEVELAHQELLLKEALNELQRNEELYDRTLLSDHDLDLARIAHAAAQSSHQNAELAVVEAQRELELRRIVAPFDGRVQQLFVQAGETINGRMQAVKLITLRR